MRNRGPTFWNWSDSQLQTRTHEEELDDGLQFDVHVRLSRTGGTQMFIGVYQPDGRVIVEETYRHLPGLTMSRALVTGTQRARAIAIGSEMPLEIASIG